MWNQLTKEFKPTKFVHSDALEHACAAFVQNQETVFHQNWSETERSKSSTWELKTVALALGSCKCVENAEYSLVYR